MARPVGETRRRTNHSQGTKSRAKSVGFGALRIPDEKSVRISGAGQRPVRNVPGDARVVAGRGRASGHARQQIGPATNRTGSNRSHPPKCAANRTERHQAYHAARFAFDSTSAADRRLLLRPPSIAILLERRVKTIMIEHDVSQVPRTSSLDRTTRGADSPIIYQQLFRSLSVPTSLNTVLSKLEYLGI